LIIPCSWDSSGHIIDLTLSIFDIWSCSKAGQSLYAAVKAGDLDAVRRLLAESDETSQSQLQRAISTMPDDFYSDSSNNSNLVPGCQVEIDVGGKWLEGTVLKVESGKVHVHMSGTAMGGAAFDQWVDLQEECIRPPSEGGLHGFTPLMCACSLEDGERAREIVELLLEKGADVAAMDNLGNTCVHWAAMAGHAEVIRLVASGGRGKGGAPREGKGDGEGDEEKEDLKRGDINLQTSSTGDTPLLLAARSGHSNVVRVLLEIGADVCVRNHERFGIIELAGERRQQSSELREGVLDAALELKPSLRTLVLCSKADSAQQGVSGKGGESVEDKRTGAIMGLVRDMPKHRVCIGAKKYSPASEQDMAGEGVWASAREAADVACHAVDEVMGGRARNAFCCVPDSYLGSGSGSSLQAAADASAASAVLKSAPAASEAQEVSSCPSPDSVAGTGHQVAPARPVECAAVAALHALNAHKGSVSKVAIVDLDARHCAGTEEWVRGMEVPGRVLLCSSHVVVSDEGGAGAIAGAGGAGDGVVGAGRFDDLRKFIVNEPLHPLWKQAGGKRGSSQREVGKRHIGSGRIECREQITRRVVPCLRAFCPDIVILVVGFNGLSGDSGNPSSGGADGIDLVDEDYYWMTQQVVRVASVCCEGRLVSILKGGEGVKDDSNGVATRDYRELAGAAAQHLRALTGY
jgi:acetoin utilization deacetylase AcuC-like enzyme